jgi:hypothetical protein
MLLARVLVQANDRKRNAKERFESVKNVLIYAKMFYAAMAIGGGYC